MFIFGPPNVEHMKQKRDVKGLISALGYVKDAEVRRSAAAALWEIGDARAVEPLIAALKDEVYVVRINAIKALGKIGDPRAVVPLISVLKDRDTNVRIDAAEALGMIGDARAVDPLIAALKDEDYYVGESAAEALGKIGTPAVEPLIDALKDENTGVRKVVVKALINLYISGQLDEKDKKVILAHRLEIKIPHEDGHSTLCSGEHVDHASVEFPL